MRTLLLFKFIFWLTRVEEDHASFVGEIKFLILTKVTKYRVVTVPIIEHAQFRIVPYSFDNWVISLKLKVIVLN